MASLEESPLLNGGEAEAKRPSRYFSAANRVLLAGILISGALSFTQVPILYAIRLMECDEFYKHSLPFQGPGDRCNRKEIDAATAAQVSLLGLTTVFFGVMNLFVAGWQVKKWGPRTALVLQTSFPVLRTGTQVIAVMIGARQGVLIIQSSQVVGFLAGQAGHLLCLNTAAGEVVAPSERTGMFGKLQGAVMLGTAAGYLLGGIVGDAFGTRRPFEVSTVLFALSAIYSAAFIPYVDPNLLSDSSSQRTNGLSTIFAPFKILMPQRLRLPDGRIIRHFGITILATGVFLGVLATGYAPLLIQMYATAAFDFRPTDNGYLMATNSLIRGLFLIFLFPKIISTGRKWYSTSSSEMDLPSGEQTIPTAPEDFDPIAGIIPEQEPVMPMQPVQDSSGRAFDLFFLRWSLVADGLVTAYTAFATNGWQIYLAGFLLPLASGSAPASKGVITEMCPPWERSNALQAMTLVENVAMLSTLGLFGYIFSAFSNMGKAYLTFFCNAAVALVAVAVLFLSNFPPERSKLEKEMDENEEVEVDGETGVLISSS